MLKKLAKEEKLVGLPPAIIILERFYPARPLVNIREWPWTILPVISRSFVGNMSWVRADPLLGVV